MLNVVQKKYDCKNMICLIDFSDEMKHEAGSKEEDIPVCHNYDIIMIQEDESNQHFLS